MSRSHFNGPVASLTQETDGGIFIPASAASFYTGTWTDTRVAAGHYVQRKTAAANSINAVWRLSDAILQKVGADPNNADSPHDIRGFEINSIDVIYKIATDVLTAHTYDVHQTTFANNVAPAIVSTVGGTLTGTLATAVQANPYVTRITFGTPYVVGDNTALRDVVLELSATASATTVLDYYGIYVNCDYNLL